MTTNIGTGLVSEVKMTLESKIKELGFTEQGAGYSEKGCRNPIRDDAQWLLTTAVAVNRPRRILELGTAFALSGLCLLRGDAAAHLTTIEFDKETAETARQNFNDVGLSDRVTVLHGDAGDIIPTLEPTFDMVFFDHEKERYITDLNALTTRKLITKGCVLIADNVTDREEETSKYVEHVTNWLPTTLIETTSGQLISVL